MPAQLVGSVIVYGACTALALAATLIWPESHYPWAALGVFLIRVMDAVWELTDSKRQEGR